jgi:hypothetical protein
VSHTEEDWKYWTMHLRPGQRVKVLVSYDTDKITPKRAGGLIEPMLLTNDTGRDLDPPYRELGDTNSLAITYTLHTGSRWKGSIGDCRVILHLDEVGREKVRSMRQLPDAVSEKEIVWHWKNIEPTFDIEVGLYDDKSNSDSHTEQLKALYEQHPDDPKLCAALGFKYRLQGKEADELQLYKRFLANNRVKFDSERQVKRSFAVLYMLSRWVACAEGFGLDADAKQIAAKIDPSMKKAMFEDKLCVPMLRTSKGQWHHFLTAYDRS